VKKLKKGEKEAEKKLRQKLNPSSSKLPSKEQAMKQIKDSKGVTVLANNSTEATSSTELFKQLQEEAKTGIKQKKMANSSQKLSGNRLKASNFKL